MKRSLFLALLALVAGAGVFIAWMNAGGGAAVVLSDDEMAAARESGAGAQVIAIEMSESQSAVAGESTASAGEASAAAEPVIPRLADLKTVTDRALLERWAGRTRAAREASAGEDRLLLTVLLAEIERLRGQVSEARALAMEGVEGLPSNSRARQVNAATIMTEIVTEAGDGGMGAVLKNLPKIKTYKAELRAAVELDPTNADARVAEIIVLAFAPFPVGNRKKAQGLIEELGPHDEFRRDFWRAMLVSIDEERREEALDAFRTLEAEKPGDPDVLFTIGDLLGKLERWSEAVEVFDSLLVEPLTRQGYNALYQSAKAREKLDLQLDEALALLERIERDDPVGELMPSMDRVHYHKGRVLEKLGRLEEARASYLVAEGLKPGETRVADGLARVDAALAAAGDGAEDEG
ncbi:MAG: tetratricopeptide repeat protein [Planctomycetota bacterium]|nr:tetratricopeptide repeat protein [Planctomycetota bacterium]MEC8511455.1 tetratricopeptide repeat protein [Planctomycetota bacterium]